MRYIWILALLLSVAQAGLAQLSGPLSGTLGPGAFHVVDTISVDSLNSLTLLPGTSFIFDGPFPFRIYGTLLAEGTETDSVVFTTDTLANPDRWRGLRFSDTTSSRSRLAYCRIERGHAVAGAWLDERGGGVCCNRSSPRLANCIVTDNAADWDGGGLFCWSSSAPVLTHCTFSRNSARDGGGGMCCFNYQSWPILEYCVFNDNVGGHGGGVCVESNASSIFEHCIFSDNRGNGGGVWCTGSANFTDCEINGNWEYGAYCDHTHTANFVNCVIWGNSGGAVFCWQSAPSFVHCSLVGNRDAGVYCVMSTPIFHSSIIAFSQGPGIFFFDDCSTSQIEYSNIFDNSGGDIILGDEDSFAPPGIGVVDSINANGEACDIYSNIFLSPHFVDYASYDLHLTDSSWCLGAADPANPPPADIEGNPRPNPPGSRPDIGAYESELATPPEGLCGALRGTLGPGIFHVTCTISVNAGDTLRLVPGTVFTFEAPFPFEIGGTLLAEGTESDSIVFTTDTLTILNRWRGLRFLGSGSSNSHLAYCVIENGCASGNAPNDKGGGLYFDHSSPALEHCTIACNSADSSGGGVYCEQSSPVLTNCTITDNTAKHGSGIYCALSSPTVTHASITNNIANNDGGGIVSDSSSGTFIECIISDNAANGGDGGGIFCVNHASSHFQSSTVSNNIAAGSGGGVHCENNSFPHFENVDITGNTVTGQGGGISCAQNSSPTFSNCSITTNSVTGTYSCGGGAYFSFSSPVFTQCTFEENFAGGDGGGVGCLSSASAELSRCIIISNSAGGNGAGIYCRSSTAPLFTKCTIAANSAGGNGGGMYCHTSSPVISSSIFAFAEGAGIYFSASLHCQIIYCDIFGNSGGAIQGVGIPDTLGDINTTNANGDSCDTFYNIFLNPMFVDTAAGDYHLLAGSPCIDAGDPILPFDPDSTVADIGAFYYHQNAVEPSTISLPTTFALYPNWPNPFNSTTRIRYDLPTTGSVTLTIFNLLGQRVTTLFDGKQLAGTYTVAWNANDLPSGLYFCRMDAAGFSQTRKMMLVK